MLDLNQLYNMDCMEGMKQLPHVDFILTDPPYPDNHTDKYNYKDGIKNENKKQS